jgi:hypothetical protein
MSDMKFLDAEAQCQTFPEPFTPDELMTIADARGELAEVTHSIIERLVTDEVLREVAQERVRQNVIWGEQNHPDGTGSASWKGLAELLRKECDRATSEKNLTFRHILEEEIAEAFAEADSKNLRTELVQVAAVAVSWIEAIDRRSK